MTRTGETRKGVPCPMSSVPGSFDILLRLSLVPGFTLRHLAVFRGEISAEDSQGPLSRADQRILVQGREALDSRDSGERLERVRERCERAGIRIFPFGSTGYPEPLTRIADAPLILYGKGAGDPAPDSVALVGSRAATETGKEFARILAADLACSGLTVISGMARGIDTAAHEGALRGGGETVAVLGCGADILYPPESRRLRDRILERGGLLSEFPPGTPPLRHHFPMRNRLISGMARGVVVVEAPERSGALITARIALDQGREVMAVPGSPLFPHTAGSNRLLREGATPVTGAEEVLQAVGRSGGGAGRSGPDSGDRELRILRFLRRWRHVDEIVGRLGIPVPDLLPLLLDLEFRKLLERRAGDYYKKTSVPGDEPAGS